MDSAPGTGTKDQRQERKVVTVLFCDLVGFTSRAEALDPEDVAALLGPYHARLKEELERHGGTVEKFIGDAVMALFGAPLAHEDDPERAVRAALAIREYAEEEGIELRIGIATGEALVTLGARPEQGETMATGDVVNTAARLESAAPVNGILVGAKTFEASKDAIEYRELEPVEAKGKTQPLPVREALRARARITLDRLHAAPLVGRERELDLLVDALARARSERQPQLVTLVGIPGIGKSRLVYELLQVADRDQELIFWRQGRCLPYGDGVTYSALGEIVTAHLGVLETDAVEVIGEKLLAVPDEWIRTQLRPLVGLGVDELTKGEGRQEAFAAWRRYLEDIAAERPLTLVLDDLHWADGDLLDFVDHLVDWATGVPLLVLCTARPELFEKRPAWGGGKTNALTVSLSPLSDEQTARLVAGFLQRAVMPAELQETLLERAGGNPLYAEQYARLLAEREVDELPLPQTVQGIIAARLDGLEPAQKALLQDAAVVGKTFRLGAVSAISGADSSSVATGLHALELKGFTRRERETSLENDTEYAFLHVLVRDVAYGQIPRARRAEQHRLAAEWIEGVGQHEGHAEMLAHHYGEALDLTRAAGLETQSLEAPASRAFRAAGDRSLALHAYTTALRFYERALELWPDTTPGRSALLLARARALQLGVDEARSDLLDEARDALLAEGDLEGAAEAETHAAYALLQAARPIDALERARSGADLLEAAPPSPVKAYVLANLARFLAVTGDDEAIEVAAPALAMAEDLGRTELKAHVLNSIGVARVRNSDFSGLEQLEESLRLALEHGSPLEISRIYNNLAAGYWLAGRMDECVAAAVARLALAERLGLPTGPQRTMVAIFAYTSGRWQEAERLIGEMLAAGEAPMRLEPYLLGIAAQLRLARDDVHGASADCERALDLVSLHQQDEDAVATLRMLEVVRAQIALAEGRRESAEEIASSLLVPQGLGNPDGLIELALLVLDLDRPGDQLAEQASTRPDDPWCQVAIAIVRGGLDRAADRLGEFGAPSAEAAVRMRAAARLVAQGRRAEADAQLQKALAFYRSVGATRYIREAEALRATTA